MYAFIYLLDTLILFSLSDCSDAFSLALYVTFFSMGCSLCTSDIVTLRPMCWKYFSIFFYYLTKFLTFIPIKSSILISFYTLPCSDIFCHIHFFISLSRKMGLQIASASHFYNNFRGIDMLKLLCFPNWRHLLHLHLLKYF